MILLQDLIDKEAIAMRPAASLDSEPTPLPQELGFDRLEGMLWGLAVGDALGVTSEGLRPEDRQEFFGEVRDYLPLRTTGRREGIPSDDTQMAFWTLEQMLEDGEFVPEKLAERFATERIYGMGSTVEAFRNARERSGRPWWQCGQPSAGNGALMRIAPMVVPHLREPSPQLWADTAMCSAITHNDTASIASCIAFVAMLWDLLSMTEAPAPTWWIERFLEVARPLETDTVYKPRDPRAKPFAGSLTQFVEERVPAAHKLGMTTLEACESWYSGAYLLETVPCVLYILMSYGNDPEEAIVRAVNDTRDNDTIGAIVGAAVGALHGRKALPDRWIRAHTGRTRTDDDGRIAELIEAARLQWWEPAN